MGVIHKAGSKQAFFDWLSMGNASTYSPSKVVFCIDRISEYAISKKICQTDFWCITQPSDFEHIYTKILGSNLLRISDRNIYKTFIVVGQLYLKFLREKLFSNDGNDIDCGGKHISVTPLSESTDKQEVVHSEKQFEKHASHDINPEALVAWLTTQPNANGRLYLERVVRQYISCLRYAPANLNLTTRVNRNVFSCKTVEELNSLWEVFKSAPNYKDVNQRTSGQFSAGLSCLSRYLEYLSGCQENTQPPIKTSKPFPTANQADQDKPHTRSPRYVDFDHPELCAKTQPVSCTINGRAVIPNKPNWSQLLVAITERLIAENNTHLAELDKLPLYGSKAFFLPRKANQGTCVLLSNGKWIYTNYNPQTIVVIIGNLCRHCNVGLEDVSISIASKNMPTEQLVKLQINDNTNSPTIATMESAFEPELLTAVSNVLSAYFPNGFRIDSPIELIRFRSFAADDFNGGIPLANEDLKKAISLCGSLFEGKVYVVGKETESRLKEEVDAEVVSGAEIIYYASVYARHESWLFVGSVISDDMLKEMLKTLYPMYQHKANYFSTKRNNGTELSIIRSEILRVWNGDTLLNYEQISERLPYIPLDKIRYVLAMNRDFIWNSTEIYTHAGMIDISDEERAKIEDYVAAACRTDGYASISGVPLDDIVEHNNELTPTAIHNAVYAIVLSGKYEKRGKIITLQGDILDALVLMKEYCRSIDKCTLQELLHYEQDITGDAYPWIALEAGYAVLVKIAEDAFVAEKYIHFDVVRIDEALDIFVTGEYLPLKVVTTFAAFPHCGQVWNLFLLESYCRRFSQRYRFDGLTMNSRNAGAIVRKSCELTYTEIMADAVAAYGVELKKTNVIEYLRDHGYIGKRFIPRYGEMIEQAKTMRERRD